MRKRFFAARLFLKFFQLFHGEGHLGRKHAGGEAFIGVILEAVREAEGDTLIRRGLPFPLNKTRAAINSRATRPNRLR